MTEIVREFSSLCLNDLSDEWVQNVYYSEFLEYGELPEDYESILDSANVRSILKKELKIITNWLDSSDEDETKCWTFLSQKINYKSLLALLGYFIDSGNKNVLSKDKRGLSLMASRVYYKLLSIPGYKAYDVYHSQLFANSLSSLTYPKRMIDQEDTYFNSSELIRDINRVLEQLCEFVADLKHIITNLRLSASDMNFEDILSSFVDVTGGAFVTKLGIDRAKLARINEVILDLIDILICQSGGSPKSSAIQLLFKCMHPKLIAASVDSRYNNNTLRASYISFCALLLDKYGETAMQGYSVLIQHLCYTADGLERVEVRTARVSLITSLMELLPQKLFCDTVKWLIKLSTTAKVAHRQVALELIAKFLSIDADSEKFNARFGAQQHRNDKEDAEEKVSQDNDMEVDKEKTTETDDDNTQLAPETDNPLVRTRVSASALLRAVYERASDASGTLRARALAVLTDALNSPHNHVQRAIKDLEGEGTVSRIAAAAARGGCDERAAVRRAAATLARRLLTSTQRARTDYAMLVGLCRDASIIVRVAAITALGELLLAAPCDALVDAFLAGPMHQLADPEVKIQEQVAGFIQQILLDRLRRHPDAEDQLPWMFLQGVVRHNMRRQLQTACAMLAKSNCIKADLLEVGSSHLSHTPARDLQSLVLLTSVAEHVRGADLHFALAYYCTLEDDDLERDGRAAALVLELLGTWAATAPASDARDLRQRLLRRLATVTNDGCRPACVHLAAQLDPDNIDWATELMQISERRALAGGEVSEWVRAADLSLVARAPPDPALLRLFLDALAAPPPEWCDTRRALCVAGAGRLCVRSRVAAAAIAPPLAALLRDDTAPLAARLNALLALTDCATRYSCIVEAQLDTVCACLAVGGAVALRRAAARAITRLLLAGFLRLRTPLYYRYCALLSDEDAAVRSPAEYYVTSALPPDAIYHHFVDCIVHYNTVDTEALSYDARQLIYDVMLQRLSAVQRLNVQCRLARELLAAAADEDAAAPPPAALLDAIALLCGPRMRLPSKKTRQSRRRRHR
ncbi:condensin-2 complex subunit D3-like isoform X2 [Aricia agestis]|uniref:condensin-2 complex subunit D3-like isoform X2 n=1 Tax=Aricia agestis TaxID=91739 RepID=UPI001C206C9C|nr:condensin-2 complex subunit D3-like isoform X2 [Aricia agestis]